MTQVDKDGVCINVRDYGTMHHSDPEEVLKYNKETELIIQYFPMTDRDLPGIVTLDPGSSFCLWNGGFRPRGSAWSAAGGEMNVEGPGWVKPDKHLVSKTTVIQGDAVAYFSWFLDNFGHVMHDNLPVVAWLRSSVPDHVKFILPNTGVYRSIIEFLDPEFFAERVVWADYGEEIKVEGGTLTVAVGDRDHPIIMGNNLMKHLRNWIQETHPRYVVPPSERTVVFYTRGSLSGHRASHGRVVSADHERNVLALVEAKMKEHNKSEHLVVFDGQDKAGNTLSILEQFRIFRTATSVIGPHGSGLPNLVWTDPAPENCDERTKVLEFIPGSDSPQVQNFAYRGYYVVMRGLPLDWNQITYAANSTSETTFIRLPDLAMALDAMWGPEEGRGEAEGSSGEELVEGEEGTEENHIQGEENSVVQGALEEAPVEGEVLTATE